MEFSSKEPVIVSVKLKRKLEDPKNITFNGYTEADLFIREQLRTRISTSEEIEDFERNFRP